MCVLPEMPAVMQCQSVALCLGQPSVCDEGPLYFDLLTVLQRRMCVCVCVCLCLCVCCRANIVYAVDIDFFLLTNHLTYKMSENNEVCSL